MPINVSLVVRVAQVSIVLIGAGLKAYYLWKGATFDSSSKRTGPNRD